MANKLTTMGYFIKRLRDSGYVVDRVYVKYSMTDPRAWTVVIDPGCGSIICTCFQNAPEPGKFYFELSDGGQYIPGKFVKLETSSIETFISWLVKFGINNKSRAYQNKKKAIDN